MALLAVASGIKESTLTLFSVGHITHVTLNFLLGDFSTVGAIVREMTVGLATPLSLQGGLLSASPVTKGPNLMQLHMLSTYGARHMYIHSKLLLRSYSVLPSGVMPLFSWSSGW